MLMQGWAGRVAGGFRVMRGGGVGGIEVFVFGLWLFLGENVYGSLRRWDFYFVSFGEEEGGVLSVCFWRQGRRGEGRGCILFGGRMVMVHRKGVKYGVGNFGFL